MTNAILHLFNEGDVVTAFSSTDKRPHSPRSFKVDQYIDLTHPYWCINPIIGNRQASNVVAYRNFLFECDTLPLEQQLVAWTEVAKELPVRLLVYSGGKSYHAYISVSDELPFLPGTSDGIRKYSEAWKALAAEITRLQPELGAALDKTSDCCRIGRVPYGIRTENRVKQVITMVGKLISAEAILKLVGTHIKRHLFIPSRDLVHLNNGATLEEQMNESCMKHLKAFWEHADFWCKAEGNYTTLFRYSLWTLEETGCGAQELMQYFDTYTRPVLLANGYPLDRVDRGLKHALAFKGLL